ncbi:hypothetical protein POSPLADRAFT_1147192 [Postia placenta MAD-698-R-SB12]|uniref:Heme haloperoxidase family profile domain-containing protein n=1 Tax=Postia placenta MAD-698-R-SB12 TaxID=670580 RepID=A0A1X6MVE1_9APHY|nr:hypothetical protein POSPLADRAFT_1147192 [Postia placenta MAD-698-R-SB12]OSX60173.1 hypothetical protein POSPLADRAFT_1147192 [Postia placenta MAD-698-R-SB12]
MSLHFDHSSIDHSYQPPIQGACRSPCPALNALANHGYLPRDGQNVTVPQLVHATTTVYHLSYPLALILSVVGAIKCGNGWSIDLHALAKHGAIEHDGSLVHADTPSGCPYAPTTVDSDLVQQLLSVTPESSLSLHDFARARAERDVAMCNPLDKLHAEIARGESALTVEILGSDGVDKLGKEDTRGCPERRVSKAFIEQWFVQEKLPDGWRRPEKAVGLLNIAAKSKEVAQMVLAIRSGQSS